jgi:hypothetical protein
MIVYRNRDLLVCVCVNYEITLKQTIIYLEGVSILKEQYWCTERNYQLGP